MLSVQRKLKRTSDSTRTSPLDIMSDATWIAANSCLLAHQDSVPGLIIDGLCCDSDFYHTLISIEGSRKIVDEFNNNNSEGPLAKRTSKVGVSRSRIMLR